MASLKFENTSPYKEAAPGVPREDTKYKEYLRNLNFESTGNQSCFGFALFGVGRAGTIHLSFLLREPRVKLLYIVEDDKSKWDKLRQYWYLQDCKLLSSSEAFIVYQDPQVRAVVVASPTYTHEEVVTRALNGGKGVFCEKPIAESYEKTRACFDLAKEVGQPLLSAFNRRFDPSYASVRDRVRSGEVGRILTVKVCSRDSPLPSIEYLRTSGGIFHDCAVHDIDMTLYVLGEYPTRVTVMATANIPEIAEINDYDTVAIMMGFESGAVGIIDLSRHCIYGYDQRLEVFGQKGMIKAENQQPLYNIETYTHKSTETAPIAYSFPSRYWEAYQIEMRHFIDVLQEETTMCIDGKDTLAVTRIASACEEAVRTGNVVEIKWAEEDLPSSRAATTG